MPVLRDKLNVFFLLWSYNLRYHLYRKKLMANGSVVNKLQQKAQLPLREKGVSFVLSSYHSAIFRNLAFLSLVTRFVLDFWQTYMATDACESTRTAPTVN